MYSASVSNILTTDVRMTVPVERGEGKMRGLVNDKEWQEENGAGIEWREEGREGEGQEEGRRVGGRKRIGYGAGESEGRGGRWLERERGVREGVRVGKDR